MEDDNAWGEYGGKDRMDVPRFCCLLMPAVVDGVHHLRLFPS